MIIQSIQTRGVVEVFAGIGSVARGFSEGGSYTPLLLNDIDECAKSAYILHAGGDTPYIDKDIRRLHRETIARHISNNKVFGILGCPPCQGFSEAGQREHGDPRNRLVSSYFRLIDQFEPEFFVMENVERLLEYELFKKHISEKRIKYNIWTGVLNSALYGVPQTRSRAIVIGYHRDLGIQPSLPKPTHLGNELVFDYGSLSMVEPWTKEGVVALGLLAERKVDWSAELPAFLLEHGRSLKNLITLEEALGDLPSPSHENASLAYKSAAAGYASMLRGDAEVVHNHKPWIHRPETVKRLTAIAEGGALHSDGERGRSRKYFSQAYARLHRKALARTITTNFHNAGSGRFLHYEETRTLTLREAARLQGIPDSFRFDGHMTVAERLIGNAFPQPMAKVIADHVSTELGHNL